MKHTITIGIDLGDKNHLACLLDTDGRELRIASFRNTPAAIEKFMDDYPNSVIAMEASTHSPWISRLLSQRGHTVYVGNPRKLRCIWNSDNKTDKHDARMLARLARLDPHLLSPVTHRRRAAQDDLQWIKARAALVEVRSKLVNQIRSGVKALGHRLPAGWSTQTFATKALQELPDELLPAFTPLLRIIQETSEQIASYDKVIDNLAAVKYPQTKALQQVAGVGALTALCYVLTIDDPSRFKKSRDVGPYLGLVPRRDQSGESDKQLRITKAGNTYLRKLLVGCAQYILGPFGEACDLRRFGERLAARGGKNARKRAVVAVSRKLAVLLHRLWVSDEVYERAVKPRSGVGRARAKAAG